ncbi:class I SAM-dependent methyltransferase [Anoxybacillus flavithermus]|nr:class I SAM-dependent methyltransferase [Anoxybacillus flavithermus]MBE2906151.1 class I SAM-dependent methyltransferase [Anoxybacillus flavithermus]MBE2914509.1 class I SAM-dependent methyltransferase [Anoxybacillus flavithermus]MBE2922614.1 class I SAM-dependent methyltransferase [Anoxybacillus flavithermus]MBE2924767.1 class I SAM-dependent methyltransferase [Anoxybacillus flavithermus]MBE2927388.1 class I SAM-dependent methyltransferase [Anoxybacillus flavithermus]
MILEKLFTVIDETATWLQEELKCSYLEAVAETGENIFHEDVLQEEVSELLKKRLKKAYQSISLHDWKNEHIRKALQLAMLKGMKEYVQPHHQMTPDAVSVFIGYLVDEFTKTHFSLSLLDPAIGTGNLMTAVLNQLTNKKARSYGADADDLLLKLAYVNANLQQHEIQLFHQDSLKPLFIEPVDVVVCDLPIGYYPDDENAKSFRLHAKSGHSYAHYLFIEQSIRYTKEGGYLFFLIPNMLFTSDESKELHALIKEETFIQGLLQLPRSMFKNEAAAKSIFILQKKGTYAKAPKQALLAQLPSFSNKQAMQAMVLKLEQWLKENRS